MAEPVASSLPVTEAVVDSSSTSPSKSPISSFCADLVKAREKWLHRRIFVDGDGGMVRYVGPVVTSKKSTTIWLGIDWDSDTRGKHDGSVTTESGAKVRYFQCGTGHGSFIKPVKASLGRDLLTVLKERFSFERAKSDLLQQREIEERSGFKVEFVGWDKQTRQLCDLKSKQMVCLDRSDVSYIEGSTLEELTETVPNLRRLDMTECLVSDWGSLVHCSAFSNLNEITLSCNPLTSRFFHSGVDSFRSMKDAFPNLIRLTLNRSISPGETLLNWNPLWFVVYQLALVGAFPNLSFLGMAVNNITHLKVPSNPFELINELYNNIYTGKQKKSKSSSDDEEKTEDTTESKSGDIVSDDDDVDGYGYATELIDIDTQEFVSIFPNLMHVNLGGNELEDWDEILRLFGSLANLDHLELHSNRLTTITYPTTKTTITDETSDSKSDGDALVSGPFPKLKKISLKRNQFKDLLMLDALNRFPMLSDLNIFKNPIGEEIGDSKMRDLTVAKIAALEFCNGSEIAKHERSDAELYYLKWINQSISESEPLSKLKEECETKAKSSASSESDIQLALERMALEGVWADTLENQFGRYKELVRKHGVQKVKKKREESFDTCYVTIKSMDPESITAAPLEKRLPLSMSVGQLKMLCKRAFKLDTRYQRLMLKNPGASFPSDMDDDSQPLSFYNVKDGGTILMQSSDFSGK